MGACASGLGSWRARLAGSKEDAPLACDEHPAAQEHFSQLFPMYVVRVSSFLGMSEALPHQVLRRHGLLLDFDAVGSEPAAFVSHQWCGRDHADPEFKQLRMLRNVFQSAAEGTLQLNLDIWATFVYHARPSVRAADLRGILSWTMWYDYFSVPQPDAPMAGTGQHANLSEDLGKAVFSLAAYVQKCAYFFILAPFVQHEEGHYVDYAAWKSRGWCRLERMARVLSPGATSLLLVRRADAVFEVGPDEYLFDPVARGGFSHEEDRCRLEPLVKRLLAKRLAALSVPGQAEEYRRLVSWCPLLLDGFPGVDWRDVCPGDAQACRGDAADRFRSVLRLPRDDLGPRAVLLAAACGDVPALQSLVSQRASLECVERQPSIQYFRFAGQGPLHVAAASGHVAALGFLLEHRADANAGDRFGLLPLHMAAYPGSVASARKLLESLADIDAQNKLDATALELATNYGRSDLVRFLLKARCQREMRQGETNALHGATVFGSGVDVVRLLLEGGVSPHNIFRPETRRRSVTLMLKAFALAYRVGLARSFFCAFGFHTLGATPLHFAVAMGHWGEARALMEARADPGARNDGGASARELADIFATAEDAPFPL